MMHCVIIDDEMNGVISLKLLIAKFFPELKVVACTTQAPIGVEMINDYRPDIVFLDINMPVLNGFELLEKLKFRDFHLIFTTAHQEFGVRAIRQNAKDYLLKPIDEAELIAAITRIKANNNQGFRAQELERIITDINEKRNLKIPLHSKGEIEYVRPVDIACIEASSNHSLVTLVNGSTISVSTSLKEFEEMLCDRNFNFMRIHHSYIINTDCITRYIKDNSGSVLISGKKSIPVSKKHKEELLAVLGISPLQDK